MTWLLLLVLVGVLMYLRPHLIPAIPPPNTPPTAHFTFTPTLLSVAFVDDSSDREGPVTGWSWTFGDAGTSTLQNPTHVYGIGGTYLVSLTVTDLAGQSSTAFTRNVTVSGAGNQLPTASFTWDVVGQTINVQDHSTDPDGSIASRDWNWGDGTAHGAAANMSHTYSAPGTRSVTLTVTDNSGGTDTDVHVVTTEATGGGMPFGVISGGWASDTTLEDGMDVMNLIEQTPGTPAHLIAQLNSAARLGIQLVMPLTSGNHTRYFSDFGDGASLNPRFDRTIWNGVLEVYNRADVKSAVSAAMDHQLLGFDVCDEPNVDGGSDGTGNTWGPTGTMLKIGSNSLSFWHVVVSANTAINATSVPIQVYAGRAIPSGTRLIFLPGTPIKSCVLTAQLSPGASTMSVSPLPLALRLNDFSNSNAIDNMVAHNKFLFPTAAVGVSHKHFTFQPAVSYAVCDFVLDQYSTRFGSVTQFRDDGLALGARDGHQIAWSINVLNGGSQIAGCPIPATGGPGVSGSNCRVTPQQILDYGRALGATNGLGQRGVGLFTWRYDHAFWTLSTNRAAFQTLQGELAQKVTGSWHRP